MGVKQAILTIIALSPLPVGMYVEHVYGKSASIDFTVGMLYGAVVMLILNPRVATKSAPKEIENILEEEREWLKNN